MECVRRRHPELPPRVQQQDREQVVLTPDVDRAPLRALRHPRPDLVPLVGILKGLARFLAATLQNVPIANLVQRRLELVQFVAADRAAVGHVDARVTMPPTFELLGNSSK